MKNEKYSTLLFKIALVPLVLTFVFWALGYTLFSGIVFGLMIAIALSATGLGAPIAGGPLIGIFILLGVMIYSKEGKDFNQTIGIFLISVSLISAILWAAVGLGTRKKEHET